MAVALFSKLHGASTHAPLVLVALSWALDALGFLQPQRSWASEIKSLAYWTMILGALASIPAVTTGLILARGNLLGHGAMRLHHLFVWPAFGLSIALGTWRWLSRGLTLPRWQFALYLVAGLVASSLMAGAGYLGGELLLES